MSCRDVHWLYVHWLYVLHARTLWHLNIVVYSPSLATDLTIPVAYIYFDGDDLAEILLQIPSVSDGRV
jgi:hypothetical protein